MHYFIITGTSSGIGLALTQQLLTQGYTVFALSRRLASPVQKDNPNFHFISIDLTNTEKLGKIMENIFEKISVNETLKGIYLINNAATISPIGPIGEVPESLILSSIQVNLSAVFILTAAFIRLSQTIPVTKRVISLTSGAAKTAYEGWAAYCTTKAGIDAMTQTIGLEQKRRLYPIEVLAVAPGVVDTPMQTMIRATPEQQFPMQPKFIGLYEKDALTQPDAVAEKLIQLAFATDFPTGEVIDLRTYR